MAMIPAEQGSRLSPVLSIALWLLADPGRLAEAVEEVCAITE